MDTTEKNSLLIVDDDTTNLMALSHILDHEYKIYSAQSGASAIEKAERFLPDIVLLDIVMPEMDGYEVLAALQKSEKTKHIPIIFISGLNKREDEKCGLKMGAVDYIRKPFDEMIVKLRVRLHMRIVNQRHRIEQLSLIDQLTEMPNRRAFDERLDMEWGRAIREKMPLSILLADADYFKICNDMYGHRQGDRVLQRIAQALKQSIKRSTDFCARWGGEEFAVLLPNTDSKGGKEIAEKIRQNLENTSVPMNDGSSARITLSIGVNSLIPKAEDNCEAFFSGADKALYCAKDAGRNMVCLFAELSGSTSQ
jgi:diguanylate cyclase (GGDEF)-like protein